MDYWNLFEKLQQVLNCKMGCVGLSISETGYSSCLEWCIQN